MARNIEQTITLPVLIKANAMEPADGRATFLHVGWNESGFVHVVTDRDAKKWLRSELTHEELDLFIGASRLKRAYEEGDEYTLRQAYEKLRPHVRDMTPPKEFEINLKARSGVPISIKSRGQKWNASLWNCSTLVTDLLRGAQLVLWHSEKHERFLPALFCPDRKSAVFAMSFAGRVRVCPKCDKPFIPPATNVDYCTPAHGEAYRMARSRWHARQRKLRKSPN